jgi:hypothetical protein
MKFISSENTRKRTNWKQRGELADYDNSNTRGDPENHLARP